MKRIKKADKKIIKNNIITIVLHIILIIFEIVGLILFKQQYRMEFRKYYTELCNIFCCVTSIICLIYMIFNYKKKELPRFLSVFRYISTAILLGDFLLALLIVAPAMPYRPDGVTPLGYKGMLITGPMIFQHVLCPLISMILLLFFEKGKKLKKVDIFYSYIILIVYAVTFLINYLNGNWFAPYSFLDFKNQPLLENIGWCSGIILIASLSSVIVYYLKNKLISKEIKK